MGGQTTGAAGALFRGTASCARSGETGKSDSDANSRKPPK